MTSEFIVSLSRGVMGCPMAEKGSALGPGGSVFSPLANGVRLPCVILMSWPALGRTGGSEPVIPALFFSGPLMAILGWQSLVL